MPAARRSQANPSTSTFRLALCGALLVLACGCAPGRDLQPLPDYAAQAYRLGGGDQIRIITFGEDQLTGEFGVNDQGNISLPLLGTIQAGGLTPAQLEARVSQGLLSRNLLRDPSVSVEVIAYRPIFVLGEVAKPGQYAYQPGMTMLTAIAVAGGFTYRAVQAYASDVRTASGRAIEGLVTPRSFVAPGDVIKVYERRF